MRPFDSQDVIVMHGCLLALAAWGFIEVFL